MEYWFILLHFLYGLLIWWRNHAPYVDLLKVNIVVHIDKLQYLIARLNNADTGLCSDVIYLSVANRDYPYCKF